MASQQPVSLSYEQAIERATWAKSFTEHPYWAIMSKMLTGTIQSETEAMLASNDHLDSNRASVAICRKMIQMPFFDIEQGRAASIVLDGVVARAGSQRNNDKEVVPWLREM